MSSELFTLVGTISINASVANETIDATMERVNELNGSLQGAEQQADSTGDSLGSNGSLAINAGKTGQVIQKLGSKVFEYTKKVAEAGIEQNATMESLTKSFSVFTDGEEAAEKFTNQLYEMAKITPLNLNSIGLGAKQLLAAGMTTEETLEVLQMWGDVTLGDNEKFVSNVRAHSKILADDRVMAKELNSMTDTGVPIRSYIADYLGIDTGKLAEQVKKGEIPSTVITEVLRGLTSEDGMFFNKMGTMMGTYSGQVEKLGDIYSQTSGNLTKSIFDFATNDALPRVSESLGALNDWAVENQESIADITSTLGNIAVSGFDSVVEGAKSLVENGDTVKEALSLIPGVAAALFSANHHVLAPLGYSAYVWGVNSQLEKSYGESSDFDEFITLMSQGHAEPYSLEDKQPLQDWIDARKAYDDFATDEANTFENIFGARQWRTTEAYARGMELLASMNEAEGKVDPLMRTRYDMWLNYKDKEAGEDLGFLDVITTVSDDSESGMQSELDGMELDAIVALKADATDIVSTIEALNGSTVTVEMTTSEPETDGSHAKGLDFVPRDGYVANLHYGEAVLNRSTADILRNGGGIGNTSTLEAAVNRLESLLQSVVTNTAAGQTLSLDTGVLVGQITPAIDKKLGTISSRK